MRIDEMHEAQRISDKSKLKEPVGLFAWLTYALIAYVIFKLVF